METTETKASQLQASLQAHEISQLSIDDVFTALDTSPHGLTNDEADARLRHFGPNTFAPRTRLRSWLSPAASAIRPLLLPLWFAAAIVYAAGEAEIAFALAIAATINMVVGVLQERKAERATAALSDALPGYAHVVRDGRDLHIIAAQVVPGDVLLLHGGEIIAADARVVDEHDLRTVSIALMGEAAPTRKFAAEIRDEELLETELPNLVYAGGRVASGSGHAVVYATGRQTAYGAIASLTETAHEEPSPLLWTITRLGAVVMIIAAGAAIAGGLVARYIAGLDLHDSAVLVAGLLAGAVPAGLLPGITLVLLQGSRRLTRQGASVRRLSSVERLGATTVICADKTGTLTQNEMTVRELWTGDGPIVVSGAGFEPKGEFSAGGKILDQAAVQRRAGPLLRAAVLTSAARLLPPDTLRPHWHILGDPVEAASIVAAAKAGYRANDLYDTIPQVMMLPASNSLPLEGRVVEEDRSCVAYLKGSPVAVLARCTKIATPDGERPLTDGDRTTIRRLLRQYERSAMRAIAFARRTVAEDMARQVPLTSEVARDLVLLGLLAVLDPPRPEVEAAIRACHRAGIRTMMLTGDYTLTAESVARRCALVETSRATTITGLQLSHMDDAALRERLREGDIVFARMTPRHKVRIVEMLDAMGEVVLVTGGAANDVPAIKAADIGIAMGTSSSAAARQAADVVLQNDNFATVAMAIAEGRSVEQRARRLVAINLAVTLLKLTAYLMALLLGWPLLLTIGQLLVVDFMGGFLPAIVLGAGPPNPNLMRRKPRRTGRSLIDRRVYRLGYVWFGLLGTVAALAGAVLMMIARGVGLDGGDLQWNAPLLAENVRAEYPQITTAYIAAGLAALVGAGLRLRSSEQHYPFGRALIAIVLIGMTATLLVLTRFTTLQPFVALSPLPWWLWIVAGMVMVAAALLEWGRQRVDQIPQ
ncbi:MAG TPA: cation-transporting P-type ATPase [Herpetosiphonaceae bacterium]|nr:cation-transporting P-type ATPase [Herpetosiphonaceae bacterium]